MRYRYSTNSKEIHPEKRVGITDVEIIDKDIIVNFSDTLREALYTHFEKQIDEICTGLRIIFRWRYGYDSVRIHLPRNVLQDVFCSIKNFLKTFSFVIDAP
jgi:hypothetical protein